jgi:hypothetical protein
MANRLQSAGNDLDNIFQLYILGDIIQSTTTNVQNGGTDIKTRYAGRDNKTGNAPISVNFPSVNSLFNKTGATYDLTLSGTVVYNGTNKTPTLVHLPSNTPTQATLTPAFQVNVGVYTLSITAGTNKFVVTLPGNYAAGTYSGSFTITAATLTGTITNVSLTFDAASHTATITSINGTFSGSASVSRTDAGTSSTTITGNGNYTGTLSTSVSISARALTLSSAGSTTLYYNDVAQTIGYTVNNIPAGGGGFPNYVVNGVSQTVVGYYTASLDANTNYSVGSPSSFVWNIENGTLVISLSTINIPNIKGDPIYYIQYYRHNGPNNSAPTVHEYWSIITTTDFALPLQSWTTSPNGWGPDPKVVDFYIYNTTYYYYYYGSRYIPS